MGGAPKAAKVCSRQQSFAPRSTDNTTHSHTHRGRETNGTEDASSDVGLIIWESDQGFRWFQGRSLSHVTSIRRFCFSECAVCVRHCSGQCMFTRDGSHGADNLRTAGRTERRSANRSRSTTADRSRAEWPLRSAQANANGSFCWCGRRLKHERRVPPTTKAAIGRIRHEKDCRQAANACQLR